MKHKNESINYLDLIPQRAETLRWHTDEQTGLITLEVENTGLFNTIAQKVFHKPRGTSSLAEKARCAAYFFTC